MSRKIAELINEGLLHRDLHSGNILLRSVRDSIDASLIDIDFLANNEGENIDRHIIQGNLLTISPEMVGHSPSRTSDIYSLGIIALTEFFPKSVREVLGLGTESEQRNGPMNRFLSKGATDPAVKEKLRNFRTTYPEDVQTEVYGLIEFLIATLTPAFSSRPDSAEKISQILDDRPNISQF